MLGEADGEDMDRAEALEVAEEQQGNLVAEEPIELVTDKFYNFPLALSLVLTKGLPFASFKLLISVYDLVLNLIVLPQLGNDAVAASPLEGTVTALLCGFGANQTQGTAMHIKKQLEEALQKVENNELTEAEMYQLVGVIYRASLLKDTALSIPLSLLILAASPAFQLVGVPASITNNLTRYFLPLSLAVPFRIYFALALKLTLAADKTKIPGLAGNAYVLSMIALVSALCLLTDLGMAGISLGFLVASMLATLAINLFFLISEDFKKFQLFHFSKDELQSYAMHIKEMLRLGLPIAGAESMDSVNYMALSLLFGMRGETASLAAQTAIQLYGIVLFPVIGLSIASSVQITGFYKKLTSRILDNSPDWSRNMLASIRNIGNAATVINAAVAIAAAILFFSIPKQLTSLFIRGEQENLEEIVALSQQILMAAGLGLIPDVVRITKNNALSALEDLYLVPALSFAAMSLLGLGSAAVLVFGFSANTALLFLFRGIGAALVGAFAAGRWLNKTSENKIQKLESNAQALANVGIYRQEELVDVTESLVQDDEARNSQELSCV